MIYELFYMYFDGVWYSFSYNNWQKHFSKGKVQLSIKNVWKIFNTVWFIIFIYLYIYICNKKIFDTLYIFSSIIKFINVFSKINIKHSKKVQFNFGPFFKGQEIMIFFFIFLNNSEKRGNKYHEQVPIC